MCSSDLGSESIRMAGNVVIPLVHTKNRVTVLTNFGELRVFSVDPQNEERPVKTDASMIAPSKSPIPGYPIVDGAMVVVGRGVVCHAGAGIELAGVHKVMREIHVDVQLCRLGAAAAVEGHVRGRVDLDLDHVCGARRGHGDRLVGRHRPVQARHALGAPRRRQPGALAARLARQVGDLQHHGHARSTRCVRTTHKSGRRMLRTPTCGVNC